MRKIYFFLFIIFSINRLSAQNSRTTTDSPFRRYEIGINTTNLLSNLFSLNNQTESVRYAFTSRYHISNLWAIRLSLGGDLNQKSQDFGTRSFDYNYNARIGLECKKPIGTKLDFSFGLDFFAQYDYSESKSNINVNSIIVSTKTNNFGLGPVLRIEYKLTDRIVLMTESFIYGSKFNREREENAGSINRKVENGYRLFLTEPTSLFISIKL